MSLCYCIINNIIATDLHVKSADIHRYLLTLPDLGGGGGGGDRAELPKGFSSITFDRGKISQRKFG